MEEKFNIDKAQVDLQNHIGYVIGEHYRFLIKNNIDPVDDTENEFVKKHDELYKINESVYKCETKEDIEALEKRVNEIRNEIK